MTTHLYHLGGPPESEQVAEAMTRHDGSRRWTMPKQDSPAEAGRLGDLGVPNHNSVGVLTVRHTSRMVYQGEKE